MKKIAYILLILSLSTTSGCAWLGWGDKEEPKEDDTSGYSERDFYEKIQASLNSNNWTVAISNLQLLESQFPFGKYAEQGQLELIYAQFRSGDYDEAIGSADRFIRLHPQHPNVDYAFYVKGLSEISQTEGFFDNFIPTDNTKRDIGAARESFGTLTELLSRFPNSPYAPDARKRLVNLRNNMARAEINVANYYFSREAYLAAANRGRYVVENFQQSPAVPDGLAVMAQAYNMLGMQELSDNAVAVLVANYPEHPSLDEKGKFDYDKRLLNTGNNFLSKITFGLIDQAQPPAFDSRNLYNSAIRDAEALDSSESDEQQERSIWYWLSFGLVK
ncbi:MAG: outer membrane protein assembly factor BamD [Porticoccaceae bacterium]|jgi:outer membrane protein assembly factor BamD|nr:outer membrane protein assembly factor BamD [Porticoccaceae bacterium]MBT5578364.1 outer membrane protein assembly factor BamD [Porticoccaceae bacterium]MBT7376354.1 outer membrane protein assembly factor BamD [Porticoccaceae bacterium]